MWCSCLFLCLRGGAVCCVSGVYLCFCACACVFARACCVCCYHLDHGVISNVRMSCLSTHPASPGVFKELEASCGEEKEKHNGTTQSNESHTQKQKQHRQK